MCNACAPYQLYHRMCSTYAEKPCCSKISKFKSISARQMPVHVASTLVASTLDTLGIAFMKRHVLASFEQCPLL